MRPPTTRAPSPCQPALAYPVPDVCPAQKGFWSAGTEAVSWPKTRQVFSAPGSAAGRLSICVWALTTRCALGTWSTATGAGSPGDRRRPRRSAAAPWAEPWGHCGRGGSPSARSSRVVQTRDLGLEDPHRPPSDLAATGSFLDPEEHDEHDGDNQDFPRTVKKVAYHFRPLWRDGGPPPSLAGMEPPRGQGFSRLSVHVETPPPGGHPRRPRRVRNGESSGANHCSDIRVGRRRCMEVIDPFCALRSGKARCGHGSTAPGGPGWTRPGGKQAQYLRGSRTVPAAAGAESSPTAHGGEAECALRWQERPRTFLPRGAVDVSVWARYPRRPACAVFMWHPVSLTIPSPIHPGGRSHLG